MRFDRGAIEAGCVVEGVVFAPVADAVVVLSGEGGGGDVGGGRVAVLVETLAPVTDALLCDGRREVWGKSESTRRGLWDGGSRRVEKAAFRGPPMLSESACVPSRANRPVTRSQGVCSSSESPSHQSPTQCSAESWERETSDGQRGCATSILRDEKDHKKVPRLLVGRLPGRTRTFVVDDARRAVAAVVRAFDERDHRV